PARTDPADRLGLVAHAELAQLDAPAAERRRHVADELAQVEPLVACVVDVGARAAPDLAEQLDAEDLQRQPERCGAIVGEAQRAGAVGVAVALAAQVVVAGAPDHAAQAALAELAARGRYRDPRQARAALAVDYHALAGAVIGVAGVVPLHATAGHE